MTDADLVAELAWLLSHSKCRFTDPKLRADWIVRKQRALAQAKDQTRIERVEEIIPGRLIDPNDFPIMQRVDPQTGEPIGPPTDLRDNPSWPPPTTEENP